jgi:hypothetical protein
MIVHVLCNGAFFPTSCLFHMWAYANIAVCADFVDMDVNLR